MYYLSDLKRKFEWGLKLLIQFEEYKEIVCCKKKTNQEIKHPLKSFWKCITCNKFNLHVVRETENLSKREK